MNGSFCNLCALALAGVTIFATQCSRVPIRAKQLSTVAILLYRFLSWWCLETFFTSSGSVSTSQSIAFIHSFWLIRSLVDPTLAAVIVCGALQLLSLSFMYFWSVGLPDPIRYVLKHGTGHADLNV